ncbi:MAG: DUF1553 domain-containing protein [Pedosphaera sp.]|nr:DUF1553 domain-containing protein [Pedosphaera sp.]
MQWGNNELLSWKMRFALQKVYLLLGTCGMVLASDATPNGPPHWAFQPVLPRISPTVKNPKWARNEVDRFILTKLEATETLPGPCADRRTLLRRATYDLTGLPPTPEEVEAFVADQSAEPFNNVVERLLASPRYGERWGRHWMDVVRYADTAGDNADYPVPEARLYRDYIIESFNVDKPYDQFVREQLAGDVLAAQGPIDRYAERVTATGFLALSRRYATAPFEFAHLIIEDAIETTGRAFMGMTFRCARCHDHKYDPMTREDYYALYGLFESTQFPYAGSEEFQSKKFPRSGFRPLVPPEKYQSLTAAHDKRLASLEAGVKECEKELASEKKGIANRTNAATQVLENRLKTLNTELAGVKRPGSPAGLPVAYAVAEGKPVDSGLQLRGEPNEPGQPVRRRAPKFLAGEQPLNIPDGASGRLPFAEWLTRPDNPLTARVMVNRIWQHHFGRGLVATPSNFGLRGDLPTHPELLDHLARRFIESDWSVKAVHRLIMRSSTYQQASERSGEGGKGQGAVIRDQGSVVHQDSHAASRTTAPLTTDYSLFPRRRLSAEEIRDSMLSVAGSLDLRRPGSHPFPKISEWQWTQHNPFKELYDSNHRSVYLMIQRLQRQPYLSLFDAPDANVSTDVRTDSTVPLQALYLMNNKFVQDQASAFARRVMNTASKEADRVKVACTMAWSREPSPKEVARAEQFLSQCREVLRRTEATEEQLEQEAWSSYTRVLLTANEFFFLD